MFLLQTYNHPYVCILRATLIIPQWRSTIKRKSLFYYSAFGLGLVGSLTKRFDNREIHPGIIKLCKA